MQFLFSLIEPPIYDCYYRKMGAHLHFNTTESHQPLHPPFYGGWSLIRSSRVQLFRPKIKCPARGLSWFRRGPSEDLLDAFSVMLTGGTG